MICGLVPSTLPHIIIIFNPHVLTLWTELQEQVLLSDHNGSGDAGTFKRRASLVFGFRVYYDSGSVKGPRVGSGGATLSQ